MPPILTHHPSLFYIFSIILSTSQLVMSTFSPAPSTLPQVDFSKMGNVGFGGSFSGLDWWSSESPYAPASSSKPKFSFDGDTLFSRLSDGNFHPLGSTNAGGVINALCWFAPADGSSNGTLYVGGLFSSLGGASAKNVASWSLADNSVKSLSNGLSGPVLTSYCDNEHSQVWFGGSFDAPEGHGGNVALWSASSYSWKSPEFGGLNGPVESITPSANGSSILFGGAFTTIFVSNTSSLLNSTSSINGTTGNLTSVQSAPGNTATVGDSGYLTPLSVSASASSSADYTIQAGPSSSQSEYSNTDVLLCPGSGVWLAEDNTVSNVNVVGQSYLSATGVRVVNGLVNGRGTTYFCFTVLPSYTELSLTYTNPSTGQTETCTTHCPLYTDPSISGQDFIFTNGALNFTGFQMQLKGWMGGGAGLGSVSLLSEGAYLSAASSSNGPTCSNTGNNGSVQTVGEWKANTIATEEATAPYLSSSVSVSNPSYPQVTFKPYVSAAGNYDIYVFVPGCLNAGDCRSRTSVDIEVFPFSGGLGWTSTISEQVDYDTKTLVYSGPVGATAADFSLSVVLKLAAEPARPESGNHYTIVADRVQLILRSLNGVAGNSTSSPFNSTSSGSPRSNSTIISNSTQITNNSLNIAFGVFEWSRSSSLNTNAANSILSNVSETSLTRLGFSLAAALNASGSAASSWVVNSVVNTNDIVFVGGDFSASNNYTNVLSIDTSAGQASALASQGLSGIVNAAVVVDGYVFFGGDFTSTASSGGANLNHIARYDPKSKAWAAVGGGVDGYVTDLIASASSNEVIILGNFSHVMGPDGSSSQTGGFAVWNTKSESWANTGVLFGNVSAGAVSTSQAYFAGKVYGSANSAVSGIAVLSTGDDGTATISSLNGVSFGSVGSAASLSMSNNKTRRSLDLPSSVARTWLSRFTDALVERTLPGLISRATAPTIISPSFPAPAVLTGAYWKNSSADGKPTITILGGNITSSSGEIGGVAFHSDRQSGMAGPRPPVSGVVKALSVIGHNLYVGGEGVSVDGVGTGLLVYDMQNGSWMKGGMPSLNVGSGSNVIVNQIRNRPNTDTVVVAGNFATAGSLDCSAVCMWDSKNAQWSTPGTGLSSGEVRSVDFAGNSYDILITAGSFVLSDGTVTSVASYNFNNHSWTALGSLPGPALAIAVDDRNITNIFAAGYSASDATPFLQQWNGNTWTAQNNSLQTGSVVQQLAFVPMAAEHASRGSIENDRMLMVSGDLYLENLGNSTSALYDGAHWYPYLIGTSSSGSPGAGSSLFWSKSDFSFKVHHFLAKGLVVLVAIAIATGLVLLFILLMVMLAYFNRRRDSQAAQDRQEMYGKEGSDISSAHQNVFANVQAALEASLIGGGLAGAGVSGATATRESAAATQARLSDPSSYHSGGYPIGSYEDYEADDDESYARETTMRYDFDGPELQEGEMPMKAGQTVIILDDEQSHEWWYARDPATGREGMVPATYVW
ncbi:uncharacterized protein L203_100255 [Cryptococcus depauperatus CBS 7841]|uniref:SH3 domain-containing protein n=1 Tax=Cryptococcus depauperatus CBS 7841 TaxID=1295531 RepID=A0AAJ8JMP5_9TREE